MKDIRKGILLAVFVIAFLAIGGEAFAQGNDYPGGFWAPSPSWAAVPTLTPVPGVGWSGGTAAGPYYLNNKAGDKVTMDFVLDWWSLGPLQIVIRTNGANAMQWVGDDTPAGQWRGWCVRCTFKFTATGDDTIVWVEYAGSPQFGAHLENFQMVPRSTFSILSPWSKQTYHNVGAVLVGAGAAVQLGAIAPCAYGDIFTCGALTATGVLSGLTGGLLLQVDPWDDAYGYPYEAVFKSAEELGLSYMACCYGEPFLDNIVYDTNVMIWAAIRISGLLDAALISTNRANSCDQIDDDCRWWQAERVLSFYEQANETAYWAAYAATDLANRYEAQGQPRYGLWDEVAGQFWQMYQNSVR